MTDQHFPDEHTGDPVSQLLRAAAQPATEDELRGMAAFVQQFTAEVTTPAPTYRSKPMFASRVTRRATAMVAITLLAAGTAAAAAGGANLNPFHSESTHVAAPHTADTTDGTDGSDSAATDDTATGGTDTGSSLLDGPNHELHGLCTAWTNGTTKDPTNPAFAKLASAADAANQTIDQFCIAVQAAHESEGTDDHGTDNTDGTDDQGTDGTEAAHGKSGQTDHTSGTAAEQGTAHGNNGNNGNGPSTSNTATSTSDASGSHSGKKG